MYELSKNRMIPKCPVCGFSAGEDAENMKPHLCWLHENMSLYRGWRG